MTQREANVELSRMRAVLQAMEQRLDAGNVPVAGIKDLKDGVDDLRLRLWAILSASNNPDPATTLERFRLRRAIEIMASVTADLTEGRLRGDHREITTLFAQIEKFAGAAQKLTAPA